MHVLEAQTHQSYNADFWRFWTPAAAKARAYQGQAGGKGGTDQLASASAGRGSTPKGRPAGGGAEALVYQEADRRVRPEAQRRGQLAGQLTGRGAGARQGAGRRARTNQKRKRANQPAGARARASRRARLPAEGVAGDGAVGDEPVLQALEQGLGFGGAVDSVAAEAVLGGDDTRVFQAQERLVSG